MTDLEKPVRRRTRHTFAHYGRRIVVMLEPGDVLAMRLERHRTIFRAPIQSVYRQLVVWTVEAKRREKKAAKKAKRTLK